MGTSNTPYYTAYAVYVFCCCKSCVFVNFTNYDVVLGITAVFTRLGIFTASGDKFSTIKSDA